MEQHWLQLQMFLDQSGLATNLPLPNLEIKLWAQPILSAQVWPTLSPSQQRQLLTKLLALYQNLLNLKPQGQVEGEFNND